MPPRCGDRTQWPIGNWNATFNWLRAHPLTTLLPVSLADGDRLQWGRCAGHQGPILSLAGHKTNPVSDSLLLFALMTLLAARTAGPSRWEMFALLVHCTSY